MTVVISVYKVANFPDGGGHFWVYMRYAQALRRLGCDVYWLEQFRPNRDPEQEANLLSMFLDKMKRFGLEGKTLLYARESGPLRFIGSTWSEAQAVLRRADLLLNFHYAIDARLLACVRRSALVDIDPGLLQLWMSTGEIRVAAHDRYVTTGETVGKPAARIPDCGVRWINVRPPICLDLWPFTYNPRSEAFTEAYRSYVQRSRGEFSCAKPSYVEFQGAWISDRTLCYLASGKPAVVQDTGPSAYLPNGEGLFRFTTLAEAIGALDAINADYERHCRAAREIAEAYFDAEQIVAQILNETLGPEPARTAERASSRDDALSA